MIVTEQRVSRRGLLKTLAGASSGIAVSRWLRPDVTMAQDPASGKVIEAFTGPRANWHWNSVGPYVTEPQKVPLILLTDRRRYSIKSKPKIVDEPGREDVRLANHGVLATPAHVVAISGHDRKT